MPNRKNVHPSPLDLHCSSCLFLHPLIKFLFSKKCSCPETGAIPAISFEKILFFPLKGVIISKDEKCLKNQNTTKNYRLSNSKEA